MNGCDCYMILNSNCTAKCTPMPDSTTLCAKRRPCWTTSWNCWPSIDHSVNRADRCRVRRGPYRRADSRFRSSPLPIARTAASRVPTPPPPSSPRTSIAPFAPMMIVSPVHLMFNPYLHHHSSMHSIMTKRINYQS